MNKKSKKKKIISLSKQKKVSLSTRFKKYKGKNLSKEFSWDKSVGNEIW